MTIQQQMKELADIPCFVDAEQRLRFETQLGSTVRDVVEECCKYAGPMRLVGDYIDHTVDIRKAFEWLGENRAQVERGEERRKRQPEAWGRRQYDSIHSDKAGMFGPDRRSGKERRE